MSNVSDEGEINQVRRMSEWSSLFGLAPVQLNNDY
jgi:hypothetical protein